MITLSTSLRAAISEASIEPRLLIDIDTPLGMMRFAQEPLVYNGFPYAARLLGGIELAQDLAGGATGAPTARNISIPLANPDGYLSQWPPTFWRNRTVTAREVIRGVDSFALRTQLFTTTGLQMDPRQFSLEAADLWGDVARQLVPAITLTQTMYPNMTDDLVGAPGTLLYGRSLVPLVLVDELSGLDARFFACVGSADWGSTSATVVERFANTLFVVESVAIARRVVSGIPVTEILIRSPIRANGTGTVTPKYADLVSYQGREGLFPDEVVVDLLQNPYAGDTGIGADSDTLLTARSFYMASSLTFSCVLTQQRALDEYLGSWAHDALTHMTLRDKLRLTPQNSRTAVASFSVGTILRDSWSVTDVNVGVEESTQQITYTERTQANPLTETFVGGSAAVAQFTSPFIGTAPVAQQVAQYWGKRNAAAIRSWQFGAALGQIAVEPGDLVTLTHSIAGAQNQLAEVVTLVDRDGQLTLTAQALAPDIFAVTGLPASLPFRRQAQRVYTRSISYALTPTVNSFSFASSHQLYGTPVLATAVLQNLQYAPLLQSSLVTANDSVFSVLFFSVGSVPNLGATVEYLDLRLA